MSTPIQRLELNEITEQIIGAAYTVGNNLGCGFLEKVYERALVHELRKRGINVEPQYVIRVFYDGIIVGDFTADLLVEQKVLVELKAVNALNDIHIAQCLNYLAATRLKLCLLLNFGKPKVEVKRLMR
jgi:GxxExxY protein